jgi:signal transduction histidine kinase
LSYRLRIVRGHFQAPQEEIYEEQESRTLSEYLSPSENLGHQCEKPAEPLQLADAYIHEISNQVTVILGSSQLALENVRGNLNVRKHIEEIVHAARRAACATHKLLELRVKHLPAAAYQSPAKEKQPAVLP